LSKIESFVVKTGTAPVEGLSGSISQLAFENPPVKLSLVIVAVAAAPRLPLGPGEIEGWIC
jgi:hypothetical protein